MVAMNVYLLVCSSISLLYGFYINFKKKPPMYFKMIAFSMISIVLSRLYYIISIACYGGIPHAFNVGFIGFGTFFLYLFFANRNQIDILVDEEKKFLIPHKIIPLIIPIIEIGVAVFALFNDFAPLSVRISLIILSVIGGLPGYMNLKHILVKDVDFGIIKSIRGFNVICILVEILTISEITLYCLDLEKFITPAQVIIGISYLAFLPLLHKEVQKWTK